MSTAREDTKIHMVGTFWSNKNSSSDCGGCSLVEEWFENFTKHELNARKGTVRSLDGLLQQRRACPRWAPTRLTQERAIMEGNQPTSAVLEGTKD
jgi:hypothetical protein